MKEFWNQRYAEDKLAYGLEPNEFLQSIAGTFPEGSKIICLGGGYGRNAIWLAEQGHDVELVDFSNVAIARAEKLAKHSDVSITTRCVDLANYDPPACDVVVAIYSHLPPEVRHRSFERAWRALRTGGAFVLEGFTPEQIGQGTGGPQNFELLYTEDTLREAFEDALFEIIEETTIDLQEGEYHHGEAHVVRMLARKE